MKTNYNTQNKLVRQGAYLALVEKIYNEDNKPMRFNGSIESMLYEFFSKTSKKKYLWKRRTFKNLLVQMYNQKCYALLRGYSYVNVLHNISAFGNLIVRDIEQWENRYGHEEQQLNSLLRHCFTIYDTPKFLERAFYSSEKKYMLWYVQLGRGKSVKSLANMPVTLTSRMAHEFRNAPDFLSVNEALRYAQAIGFGASTKVAKLIAFTRLSNIREDQETFWATVVQFFSKAQDLNVHEVNGVLDYLAYKYREDRLYSMKNRTYRALLNQTDQWHRYIYLKEKGDSHSWRSSGIKPLYVEEVEDNKTVIYRTVELTSSAELFEEGNEMQHCVSEYDQDCKDGHSAIFSFRQEVEGAPMKRLVTVEVELPSLYIVQAQAKCNFDPDAKSMAMLNQWIMDARGKLKKEVPAKRAHELQGRPAYDRLVERRQINESQEYDSALMIKVIFWALYIILRMMMS